MSYKLRVAVVGGAGHVGLPLSLLLARQKFPVTIIDTNREKIEALQRGEFPFLEDGGAELLAESKRHKLTYTTEHSAVADCDAIILTVGTPVDEHLNPKLSAVYEAIRQLQPYLKNGQVLVLRSTLFPGTSE